MIEGDINRLLNTINDQKVDVDYIDELVENIKNTNSSFDYLVMNREQALETYKDRYLIQKDILDKEPVKGYEFLISNLEKSISNEVILNLFEMDEYNYILFESKLDSKILGLLKMDKKV